MDKKEFEINEENLNLATGGTNGGAIYSDVEVTITGENVSFIENTSGSGGGAIYSSGEVDISGGNIGGAKGGVIYN